MGKRKERAEIIGDFEKRGILKNDWNTINKSKR